MRIYIFLLWTLFFLADTGLTQNNPMINQRWNTFDINKVSTQFNNTGMLCNGNEQS